MCTWCLRGPEEVWNYSDGFKLRCECWGLNPAPGEKQPVLLTAEPTLQDSLCLLMPRSFLEVFFSLHLLIRMSQSIPAPFFYKRQVFAGVEQYCHISSRGHDLHSSEFRKLGSCKSEKQGWLLLDWERCGLSVQYLKVYLKNRVHFRVLLLYLCVCSGMHATLFA